MLTYDVGHVAISLAGHDKEARYLIVGIKEDILYLADGDKRPLAKIKKKKGDATLTDYLIKKNWHFN